MAENNNNQIIEKLTYKGVDYSHLWQSDFPSSHEDLITQAYGFVFDNGGKILIIKKDSGVWCLPGGTPESFDKSFEDTLEREVYEESCVRVEAAKFIGCIKVTNEKTKEVCYQLRYTARAKSIDAFKPEFETVERKFVTTENIKDYITWITNPIGQKQLSLAEGVSDL